MLSGITDAVYFKWLGENEPKEVGGVSYCRNLLTLSECCKAMEILELGQGWGWSGSAFCASLSRRAGTRMRTVDLNPPLSGPVQSFIASTLVSYEFFRGDTANVNVGEDREFDLLYMDTSGSYEGALLNWNRFGANLRRGGYLVVDGYGGQPGVTFFVDSSGLPFFLMPYTDVYSHAVYRRPA